MPVPRDKNCAFCGKPPLKDQAGNDIKMKTCSRCKIVYYHDVDCQRKHWKIHKKTCGNPSSQSSAKAYATKRSANKQTHRSADTVHQRVTRRFKELRKEGVAVQDAMKRAREEFQPPDDLDAGSKGASQ